VYHVSEAEHSRENWHKLVGVKEQSMTTVLHCHGGAISIGKFYDIKNIYTHLNAFAKGIRHIKTAKIIIRLLLSVFLMKVSLWLYHYHFKRLKALP
jgi:hypothetical protein